MRALQVTAPGQMEMVDADAPTARTDYAIVRPEIISICGSDLRTMYYGSAEHFPMQPGESAHEIIGVVEEIAYSSKIVFPLQRGERVLAVPSSHGGAAELFEAIPPHIFRVPDHPIDEMVLAQPLGTVLNAVQKLSPVNGSSVAVIGQGGIGLMFDILLRRMGARRIVGVELSEARRAAGLRYGATHVVDGAADDAVAQVQAAFDGGLADVVVDASGDQEAINLCAPLLRRGGEIMFFGSVKPPRFEFDFSSFHSKQPTVLFNSTPPAERRGMFEMAINLVARGDVDLSGMISHRFPLEQAPQAYDTAYHRSDDAVRVAIEVG